MPPELVLESSIETQFQKRDGNRSFCLPELNFIDDKAGKPVGINEFIGRRPIAAFGHLSDCTRNAAVDDDVRWRPPWPVCASHRCGTRIRLRPGHAFRSPRQGPRRRGGEQMGCGRHEERLEACLRSKRPSANMSDLGHKRRFERASAVSALPSFATKSVRAPSAGLGQQRPHALQQNRGNSTGKFCYAARSTRTSISFRNVPKSIGLVSSASATYHPWNS